VFEFCKDLLDGIEMRAVGRKEQKASPPCPNGLPDAGPFVAGEVIENNDLTQRKCGAKLLLNPSGKAGGIDRLIEDEGRFDPIMAQCRDEGHGFPVTVGNLVMKPLTNGRPATQGCHVGLGPSFINKNEAPRIRPCLILFPLFTPPGNFWLQLLGRQNAFF